MRNYISLALATTPSGLGSRCKHVGVPTRLRIGYRLRIKCSAVAGGRGRAGRRRGEQEHYIAVRMQKRKTKHPPKAGMPVIRGGCVVARRVHREIRV